MGIQIFQYSESHLVGIRSILTEYIKFLASEYKQFPTVNLPHVLVDLGRDLLIALLIVVFLKVISLRPRVSDRGP